MNELQDSLIESIRIIAGEKLKNVNFTKSFTGSVKSIDFDSLTCVVEVNGSNSVCTIPYNLRNYVGLKDIVIVQDIFNNKQQKIVQGRISSENGSMFHVYDPVTNTIVSSVIQLWDDNAMEAVPVRFDIG